MKRAVQLEKAAEAVSNESMKLSLIHISVCLCGPRSGCENKLEDISAAEHAGPLSESVSHLFPRLR